MNAASLVQMASIALELANTLLRESREATEEEQLEFEAKLDERYTVSKRRRTAAIAARRARDGEAKP